MNRRDFLQGAAVASAGLGLSVHQAFGGEVATVSDLRLLTAGWKAARAAGRVLLVLVVPEDDAERYWRGDAWGEALTYGGERMHVLLGQVDVVCARPASVAALLPATATGDEAWAWLIDPSSVPPRFARFDGVWGPATVERGWDHDDGEDWEARVQRRAKEEIAASDARVRPFVEDFEAAAAALLVPLSRLDAVQRARLARSGDRLLHGRLPGASWTSSTGCGSHPDVPDNDMGYGFACGMGYVPQHSERFLQFLVSWAPEL